MDEKIKDLVFIGMGIVVVAAAALTNASAIIYAVGGMLVGVGTYCYFANK